MPMDVEFILHDDVALPLQSASSRKHRGDLLPGSIIYKSSSSTVEITLQEYVHQEFNIRLTVLRILKKLGIDIKERKPSLRLNVALKNDLRYISGGNKIDLKAGHYHILPIEQNEIRIRLPVNKECQFFSTSYSPEFIEGIGLMPEEFPAATKPRALTPVMSGIIQDMLTAPYEQALLRFFYENKVRELFFQLLLHKERMFPGELSAKEIEAIYAADSILLSDLKSQLQMDELVNKVELNAFKLKKGFQKLFGMGIFERLVHFRMERAKKLLIETDLPEKEIASQAGYNRLTSFVTAFRKHFGISPGQFRKQSRGI
jgi:AraC-like DNA-binding protein